MPSIYWFRRDLRLADNPALVTAWEQAQQTDSKLIAVYIFDEVETKGFNNVQLDHLIRSLTELNNSLNNNLIILHGSVFKVLPELIKSTSADSVHISAHYEPELKAQDEALEKVLKVPLVRTGSSYAVAPGRVGKEDQTPYRVFTPFYKAWMIHGWRKPIAAPAGVNWFKPVAGDSLPKRPDLGDLTLPDAGEVAALTQWAVFKKLGLANYAEDRNRPDLIHGTSKMSTPLRFGEIHPRTILNQLSDTDEVYRKEICWREFYADVLHHNPSTITENLNKNYDKMPWETGKTADQNFKDWCAGKTGYPFVDAGMRQLITEGWMHNRVRMVVASFLIKDLHIDWRLGANWFMQWLSDADIASNQHGWQWTAGSGTDASPFYRVFNPITQGKKFDPDGEYIHRYIPELRHLPGAKAHLPWESDFGYAHGYPKQIVDHSIERVRALEDWEKVRN